MKRIIGISLTLTVAAALLALSPNSKRIVPVAHAQSGCSVATLSSNYGFTGSGFASPHHSVKGAEVPVAYSGLETFDGAGNFSATFTSASNGTISTGDTVTGTYTVNSDCTGSAAFTTGGGTFTFVIVNGGDEAMVIQTDPGNTITYDVKKQ